jgi:MYXO-CTERM domain-containing protein
LPFAAAPLWLALAPWTAHAAVSVRKGPYVVDVSDTSAEVRFELASPAPAKVELHADVDGGGGRRSFDAASGGVEAAHATGLTPATRYAYDVRVAGAIVGSGHFTTAPSAGASSPVTFTAYGDDRSDPVAHAAVVRAMREVQPPSDFLVNTGDLVQDAASAADWQSFFDVESALLRERPIFAAVGNHELHDDQAGANFAAYFAVDDMKGGAPRLYRSVRFGIVRLLFLNAMDTSWAAGDERGWLERELERADAEAGVVWRVVVLHHGPWSAGPHGPNRALIEAGIPALLAAHHVDLVLSGHDHLYDRGTAGPIKYILTGGGGAPLYPVQRDDPTARKTEATYHFVEITATPEAMRFVAYRADGSVLDRCGFAPGQPWDCDAPPRPPPAAAPPASAKPAAVGASQCGCRVAGAPGPSTPFDFAAMVALWFALAARRTRVGVRPD